MLIYDSPYFLYSSDLTWSLVRLMIYAFSIMPYAVLQSLRGYLSGREYEAALVMITFTPRVAGPLSPFSGAVIRCYADRDPQGNHAPAGNIQRGRRPGKRDSRRHQHEHGSPAVPLPLHRRELLPDPLRASTGSPRTSMSAGHSRPTSSSPRSARPATRLSLSSTTRRSLTGR